MNAYAGNRDEEGLKVKANAAGSSKHDTFQNCPWWAVLEYLINEIFLASLTLDHSQISGRPQILNSPTVTVLFCLCTFSVRNKISL